MATRLNEWKENMFERGRAVGRKSAREYGNVDELPEVCEEQRLLVHDNDCTYTRGFVFGYREVLEGNNTPQETPKAGS